MSTQPKAFLTAEEYLAFDRASEYRSEYLHGEMLAMSGGSITHGRLIIALSGELYRQLRDQHCEVMPSDVRLAVVPASVYFYPDVYVVCGGAQPLEGTTDTVVNPTVVFEVLSPSTQRYDRGEKSGYYRLVETLREYLFISSDSIHVEHFVRQGEQRWLLIEYTDANDVITLESIGCTLALRSLYARTSLIGTD